MDQNPPNLAANLAKFWLFWPKNVVGENQGPNSPSPTKKTENVFVWGWPTPLRRMANEPPKDLGGEREREMKPRGEGDNSSREEKWPRAQIPP